MENLEKFYVRILNWDFLVKRGYFDIPVKYKKNEYIDLYPLTDQILFDYFNLNQVIKDKKVKNYILNFDNKEKESPTLPIIYTIPKENYVRRTLKYPNFYSYNELIKVIANNQKEIINHLKQDTHSMSKFFNQSPYKFNRIHRMQNYLLVGHNRFYKTDFSNFYHSFYTHAISWLANGKFNAKHGSRNTLADKLDRKIELEQNMETHGVPTGNLATRVVMEYCMSFFDKYLEDSLQDLNIDFYRYVDDFYFGYDKPEDLLKIKRIIQDLANEYEITLNENKSTVTTYNEITRSSQLLNYFSNDIITKKTKSKDYLKIYNQYYAVANEEIITGIKGSNKLIFSSLQYFLQGLDKEQSKEALKAMIYTSDENEYPFFMQLLQLVLNDSRLSGSFLNLLKEIQRKENKIIKENIITDYLKNELLDKLGNKLIKVQLISRIQNHENEEIYFILLLIYRLNYKLKISDFKEILESITKHFKKIDDFSLLLLINNYFVNIKDYKNDDNKIILNGIINVLGNEYSNWFSDEHWLIKYELMYGYENIETFKVAVNEYFEKRKDIKNIFSKDVMKKYSKDRVFKFYFGLLDLKYSFTKLIMS